MDQFPGSRSPAITVPPAWPWVAAYGLIASLLIGVALRRPTARPLALRVAAMVTATFVAPALMAGRPRNPIFGVAHESVVFLVADHQGGTMLAVRPDGTLRNRYLYTPYGGVTVAEGPTLTNQYTGAALLPAGGLYSLGARLYDTDSGRFLEPDSVVPGGGNPLGFDRYGYVYGNPVTNIDPSGHVPYTIALIPLLHGLNRRGEPEHRGRSRSGSGDGRQEPRSEAVSPLQGGGVSIAEGSKRRSPLPQKVYLQFTEYGDDQVTTLDQLEEAADRLTQAQYALDFVNEAIESGELDVPWLSDAKVEGIYLDPVSIPGSGGSMKGGNTRPTRRSNSSPIHIFWDGAPSVATSVMVLGHEVGHMNRAWRGPEYHESTIYPFGRSVLDLYYQFLKTP